MLISEAFSFRGLLLFPTKCSVFLGLTDFNFVSFYCLIGYTVIILLLVKGFLFTYKISICSLILSLYGVPDTFLEAESREEHNKTKKLVPSEFGEKLVTQEREVSWREVPGLARRDFSGSPNGLSMVTGKELMKLGAVSERWR